MLQSVAVCCGVLRCVAVWCSVLQCVAVCCSALQCVAVSCSVLQCVEVCCSVLQRVIEQIFSRPGKHLGDFLIVYAVSYMRVSAPVDRYSLYV